jgi:hypothetical protein
MSAVGSVLKSLGTVGWIVKSGGSPILTQNVSIAYVGVPLNLVVACGLGAYASFSFGDPVTPRSKMLNLFMSCVIIGCAFTAVTNAAISHFMHVTLLPGAQAGIGAILSCLSRFIIPAVIERIPYWLDKIPFLKREKGE